MNLTLLKGYPDFVGKRATFVGYGNGPASYARGGDVVTLPLPGYYIDAMDGGASSVSGNYIASPIPSSVGPRATWKVRWLFNGSQQGVDGVALTTPGTGGTNGTATINATGGGGTGAQVQTVTAGGIITSATVINPGTGYTTAPTFTPAAGTGALTATIGALNGVEVGAGTSLATEQVQIGGFCGQY
jgi:hypothetical protein